MSEEIINTNINMDRTQESTSQLSGGAMLRKAREEAGLHIAALAVSLKVPVKKLEALETDRFDLLPDTVFVRALAASVCRTLKIDSAPILERLPHSTSPRLKSDESGINTPFRPAGNGSSFVFMSQLSKPLVLAVLTLLVGAVVIIFVPFNLPSGMFSTQKSDVAPLIYPVPSASSEASVNVNQVVTDASALPPLSGVSSPVLTSEVAASAVSAPASSVLMPSVAANLAGTGSTTGTLVFKARGVSWVEVIDAKGVVQLRKTMAEGESVAASGVMPLSVVVGRASNMEAQVKGQTFDLSSVAKDNVARFEVK
ncbi:MAG: RodZ domain-containing protein [Rhodoferax sp.]|uniref:helix-turn-helix domain-containing protein n=1 Tax=Rhodoferax sp. TaxID=50421 RepID=UPI003015D1D2